MMSSNGKFCALRHATCTHSPKAQFDAEVLGVDLPTKKNGDMKW